MDYETTYEKIEVSATLAETKKAILCVIDGNEHWVPWSVMEDGCGDIDKKGDSGNVYIATWWLEKNGLG